MSERRSAAEPTQPGDAHRDPAHDRNVVSPTDPDPVNGQRSGLPFDGNAWLVIDGVNIPVPCRGHSGPHVCLPRRSNLAALRGLRPRLRLSCCSSRARASNPKPVSQRLGACMRMQCRATERTLRVLLRKFFCFGAALARSRIRWLRFRAARTSRRAPRPPRHPQGFPRPAP